MVGSWLLTLGDVLGDRGLEVRWWVSEVVRVVGLFTLCGSWRPLYRRRSIHVLSRRLGAGQQVLNGMRAMFGGHDVR